MEGHIKITLALIVTSVTRCDELVTTIWMPELNYWTSTTRKRIS